MCDDFVGKGFLLVWFEFEFVIVFEIWVVVYVELVIVFDEE